MKFALVFIALISHINFTMFVPHVDEQDIYDAKGVQVSDINTLTEYIDQILLGNKRGIHKDEDDDNAIYFHLVKIDYNLQQPVRLLKMPVVEFAKEVLYPPFIESKLASHTFDIQSPPPEV